MQARDYSSQNLPNEVLYQNTCRSLTRRSNASKTENDGTVTNIPLSSMAGLLNPAAAVVRSISSEAFPIILSHRNPEKYSLSSAFYTQAVEVITVESNAQAYPLCTTDTSCLDNQPPKSDRTNATPTRAEYKTHCSIYIGRNERGQSQLNLENQESSFLVTSPISFCEFPDPSRQHCAIVPLNRHA
jgi:hypothetical protein